MQLISGAVVAGELHVLCLVCSGVWPTCISLNSTEACSSSLDCMRFVIVFTFFGDQKRD
jgi:hypothetical protein